MTKMAIFQTATIARGHFYFVWRLRFNEIIRNFKRGSLFTLTADYKQLLQISAHRTNLLIIYLSIWSGKRLSFFFCLEMRLKCSREHYSVRLHSCCFMHLLFCCRRCCSNDICDLLHLATCKLDCGGFSARKNYMLSYSGWNFVSENNNSKYTPKSDTQNKIDFFLLQLKWRASDSSLVASFVVLLFFCIADFPFRLFLNCCVVL